MLWGDGRRSENIEDRRGISIPGGIAGGGVGVLVIALIAMFFGVDPRVILQEAGQSQATRLGDGVARKPWMPLASR